MLQDENFHNSKKFLPPVARPYGHTFSLVCVTTTVNDAIVDAHLPAPVCPHFLDLTGSKRKRDDDQHKEETPESYEVISKTTLENVRLGSNKKLIMDIKPKM